MLVDREVGEALAGRSSSTVSAILSDTFTLRRGEPVRSSILRSELLQRRYREVGDRPTAPGDFMMRGHLFQIYGREFLGADGKLRAERLVEVDCQNGSIKGENNQLLPFFAIEPQVVAPLSGSTTRAAEHRPLSAFPPFVAEAVLAIEDQRFYSHWGIDPWGILRALVENIRALRIVQGGSTITQQYAKNLLFTPERTLGRKVMEGLAAFSLERRLTKDQILEGYLNEVYLGQEGAVAIHGFAAATEGYFGKRVEDLSLAEAALLAGMIQAPSAYAPRRNPERAKRRRELVLRAMQDVAAISPQQYAEAIEVPIKVLQPTFQNRAAPHLTAAISKELSTKLNLGTAILSGITVYTGLAPEYQRCAEAAADAGLAEIEKRHPKLLRKRTPIEIGILSIEPYSGKIRAWVGGRDFSRNQFDHVNQAERQVGSTIKPFLYLTALDGTLNSYKVATPATILPDEPIEIRLPSGKRWTPENYDEKFRGDVTLRVALEQSLNMPAVYTAQKFGIEALARTVTNFNLSPNVPAVPALALGAIDSTLLRLTAAFGALANGGLYVEPRLYLSVLDSSGSQIASGPITERPVASAAATFVLTNLMRGVIDRGTGKAIRALGFAGDAAGKTGTSNESRDSWFVGFTPDLVTGIWIGFDDNSETGLTGGGAAAPIWARYMNCLAPFREELRFLPPGEVTEVMIDQSTGLRATADCPSADPQAEYFVRGTEPPTRCREEPPAELRPPAPVQPQGRSQSWFERLLS